MSTAPETKVSTESKAILTETCGTCKGSGMGYGGRGGCFTCGGSGTVPNNKMSTAPETKASTETCAMCSGSGVGSGEGACFGCGGSGTVPKS
ncbi:hypothetical protein E4U11_003770 [Claviceps purpurea]|nr:hypothetical protein E4U11_003770 [Claviceps purpurea]